MSEKIKNKIKDLTKLINKWNHEYFDLEKPSVDDRVYDSHLKELVELENKFPEYVLKDSPTRKIGATLNKKFQKIRHKKPMLSLNKAYSFEELEKFFNDIKEVINSDDFSFLVQPKIDGLSISLKYKNGCLVQAITRGDGAEGEDVTENVFNVIKDIPIKIDYPHDLEVRGEIYISKSNFKKVIENENIEYANARNLASGTLRQLDKTVVEKRNLSSFIYEIVDCKEHNILNQMEVVNFLEKNNFSYLSNYFFGSFKQQNKIFDWIKNFETDIRNKLEYDIDGIVLKLNEMKYYEDIGYTTKFPKYSIAYKFDEELVQTILEDIFISIGRTGIVTYNAKLKKVLLKGTMVSAATLHNYKYIEDLGINIGDEVTIKKAGEIIPKVVALSKKKSEGVFPKILTCPSCKLNLIDTKTLNNQICSNPKCEEKIIRKIIHFSSKSALNIEGLGEGVVRKLFELNFIQSIEDIFTLEKYKDLIIQEKGFGEKFWKNLYDGIKKSYSVELNKLIFALGIPQLGEKNAKSIAKKIKQFQNIKNISKEELESIKDIGDITIIEFLDFISNNQNIQLIDFLINQGINPTYQIDNEKIFPFFEGKTFVISGSFDLSRNELTKIIEDSGGNVSSTVSKKTSALILGEDGGSKVIKAKSLGIEIIDSKKLKEIINS